VLDSTVPNWNTANEAEKKAHADVLERAKGKYENPGEVIVDRCPHCTEWVAIYIDRDTPAVVPSPTLAEPPKLL